MQCDRNYVGYELDEKYYNLINKRIEEEKNNKKSSSLF
jgi:DNA modification methylase